MSDRDRERVRWFDDRTADTARAARRLTGGAATVGAALLASLQLAQLGTLSGTARIAAAAGGAAAAVAAVIAAVTITVRVMLPRSVTIHQLAEREARMDRSGNVDALVAYVHANRIELLGAPHASLQGLAVEYASALERRHDAVAAVNVELDHARLADARATSDAALVLNRRIGKLVAAARMAETRRAYDRAARKLAALLALLVAALIVLSWALNAPAHPAADLRGANLDGRRLTGVELRGANLDGMRISHADLRGTHLGGASVDGTTWIDTICPDGVYSDDAGRTCAGHLEP